MKFSPDHWSVINENEEQKSSCGLVHVRSANKIALLVTSENGVEALAGVGHDVQAKVQGEVTFKVIVVEPSLKGASVFLFSPISQMVETVGEVFTNVDRKPLESGAMADAARAVRSIEVAAASARREAGKARREADRLFAAEQRQRRRRADRQAERDPSQPAPSEVPENASEE